MNGKGNSRLASGSVGPRHTVHGGRILLLIGAMMIGGTIVQAATVTLPAGSVDGLGPAIASAGPGGTVLVEAGIHTESASVLVQTPVSIIGTPGAILESVTTLPAPGGPVTIDGALHVRNTSAVTLQGLELRPAAGGVGNTAIVIENAPDVVVTSNIVTGYLLGVIVHEGMRADITGNTLSIPAGGLHSVVIVNGEHTRVQDNTIDGGTFGIWACDAKGRATGNTVTNAQVGIILCKVPQALVISGNLVGSDQSATAWHVHKNDARGNFWGYAITDGSRDNILANNAASGNFIDVEVLGDSTFFGFFTPTASDSVIALGDDSGLTVHDCGVSTVISGNANVLDLSVVPCF